MTSDNILFKNEDDVEKQQKNKIKLKSLVETLPTITRAMILAWSRSSADTASCAPRVRWCITDTGEQSQYSEHVQKQ